MASTRTSDTKRRIGRFRDGGLVLVLSEPAGEDAPQAPCDGVATMRFIFLHQLGTIPPARPAVSRSSQSTSFHDSGRNGFWPEVRDHARMTVILLHGSSSTTPKPRRHHHSREWQSSSLKRGRWDTGPQAMISRPAAARRGGPPHSIPTSALLQNGPERGCLKRKHCRSPAYYKKTFSKTDENS